MNADTRVVEKINGLVVAHLTRSCQSGPTHSATASLWRRHCRLPNFTIRYNVQLLVYLQEICMMSGEVLTFPFLTTDNFDLACQAFVTRVDAAGGARDLGWRAVEYLPCEAGHSILRISKCISQARGHSQAELIESQESGESIEENLIEDDDQETLVRNGIDEQEQLTMEYDITFSTSYQVPVMYFTLKDTPQVGPAGFDSIYKHLVPRQHQQPLRSNGIMGGISFGYHPQSGIPAYFVHPCNTATAMKAITGGESIDLTKYLFIWLGLVGGCINLNLPSKLFMESFV